jgi:hypothetical protein
MPETPDPLSVLRSGTCSSLSGKTKLHYEFGVDPESAWHVRIAKSSGTGYYSKQWVAMEHVQRVLAKNGTKPITCHTLGPIFKGQSVNTAGFLLAVLKEVGLVQPSPDNPRVYELDLCGEQASVAPTGQRKNPQRCKRLGSRQARLGKAQYRRLVVVHGAR